MDTPKHSSDWPFLIGTCFVMMTVLGGAVYAYQRYGGEFVDGLDEQIGELIAVRARSNASAGMTDDALALFKEALATPFMDEQQRLYCIQDYVALLTEQDQYQTALTWIEEGAKTHPDDGKLAYLRFDLYRRSGQIDQAIAAADRWYAVGESTHNIDTMRAARFGQGTVYRDAQREEEALNAFLGAHNLKPGPDTALRIGRLYVQLGQTKRAREFLEEAANGGGADAEQAAALLETLPE